jgi:AcrR family transcriptional regulator
MAVPTGIALREPREQLFEAAERVLTRDGPAALTSRAITDELGVAKGVLHRHFADFDTFLAELVRARIASQASFALDLTAAAGRASVVANLGVALTVIFDPVNLGLVSLLMSRPRLLALLRESTPSGLPLLTEATALLRGYLAAEQALGRIRADADIGATAFTLIGTGHLLFVGELGGLPDVSAIEEVVASIIVGAEPGAPS